MRAEFLVVAFGADTHRGDPIGTFRLPTGFYREMGAALASLGLPTVVTQEGGYNLDELGPCVVEFLSGLRVLAGQGTGREKQPNEPQARRSRDGSSRNSRAVDRPTGGEGGVSC